MREKSNCHEIPNRISFGSFILCVCVKFKKQGPEEHIQRMTVHGGAYAWNVPRELHV